MCPGGFTVIYLKTARHRIFKKAHSSTVNPEKEALASNRVVGEPISMS